MCRRNAVRDDVLKFSNKIQYITDYENLHKIRNSMKCLFANNQ